MEPTRFPVVFFQPLRHLSMINGKIETNYNDLAERGGFEPPSPCELVVFKTTAINRSATPPRT